MDKSESITELATALSKAQGAFPDIEKKSTVKVETKGGGTYEFKYADLSEIISKTRKPLSDNGLSFFQNQIFLFPEKFTGIETVIMHSSGQWIKTKVEIAQAYNTMQTLGSVVTYARRYCLSLALGIAADEDTDANDVDPRTKSFTRNNSGSNQGQSKNNQNNQPKKLSAPQLERLWTMSSKNNISDADMKSLIKGFGFDSSRDITTDKYDRICNAVLELARKAEVENNQNRMNEEDNLTTKDIPF